MISDFSLFYKRSVSPDALDLELADFDVFVSAFAANDRIRRVYEQIRSTRKVWIVHPEYELTDVELPTGVELVRPSSRHEVEQVNALLDALGNVAGVRLCIDITGFMRHVLVFLVAALKRRGVSEITALYSEPDAYLAQEKTTFTTSSTGNVRPVAGMAGSNHASGRDHLIVAIGYDHAAVGEVLHNKDSASLHPLFGFPSLSPDMYQQSAVRAIRSGDKALETEWIANRRFAPANDPFATATVVAEMVSDIDRSDVDANVYLSPLSTKAQALGFALYWVLHGESRGAVTLLLPECSTHSPDTSVGLKRVWQFDIELS